jgi:cysteinyl-tRNA synthetase
MGTNVSDKIYNMATEGKDLRTKMPDYLREQYKTYSSGLSPDNFSKSPDKAEYVKKLAEFDKKMRKEYPDYFRKVVEIKGVIQY